MCGIKSVKTCKKSIILHNFSDFWEGRGNSLGLWPLRLPPADRAAPGSHRRHLLCIGWDVNGSIWIVRLIFFFFSTCTLTAGRADPHQT